MTARVYASARTPWHDVRGRDAACAARRGAARYEVRGPLCDVLTFHWVECRRWSGHVFAATATRREHLVIVEQRSALDPEPAGGERRVSAFCGECGSSLYLSGRLYAELEPA